MSIECKHCTAKAYIIKKYKYTQAEHFSCPVPSVITVISAMAFPYHVVLCVMNVLENKCNVTDGCHAYNFRYWPSEH